MKVINAHSINTPEHYNMLFGNRKFKVQRNGPLRAEALLKNFKGGKFIDLGCGLGPHTEMALKVDGAEVYAMDFSDKLIENLKLLYPNVHYAVGDVNKIPFDDNTFDYAVLGEVLEHMEDPRMTIKEVMRILKAGGMLAMSVPFGDNGSRSPKEHKWSYTIEDIQTLLSEVGKAEVSKLNQYGHGYIIGYVTKC